MNGAAVLLLSLGKWRYFLTGIALAALFYTVVRSISALMQPLGEFLRFTGTCTALHRENGQTALELRFTDARRLTHTAAFVTDHADAEALSTGDEVRFVIKSAVFSAGSYPQTIGDAASAHGDILLYGAYRSALAAQMLKTALLRLLLCALAAAVFIAAMKLCFP